MTFFNLYNWRKKTIPLLISGLIISCSPLNPLGLASGEYTAIAELGKISNQSKVTLKGIVVNIAPFLEGGAYQLQDATGTVWVRTDKPLPPKGSSLAVKGELKYEAIFVGKQQLGESYLLELSQEAQSSVSSTDKPPASNSPAPPSSSPGDRPSTVSKPPLLLPIQAETPSVPPIPENPTPKPSPSTPPQAQNSTPSPAPTPSTQPIAVPSPSPSSPSKNKPEENKVINPVVPSPSKTTPTKPKPPAKINVDDQFLPHKRLQK